MCLLRCRRCGRRLHVAYSGVGATVRRYHCRGAHINHGTAWCISFGGLPLERAAEAAVLAIPHAFLFPYGSTTIERSRESGGLGAPLEFTPTTRIVELPAAVNVRLIEIG